MSEAEPSPPTHAAPMPGEPLPRLQIDTVAHGRIELDALGGWRLLVVYRGRHCPACSTYLCRLRGLFDEYEALGVRVIAWSADAAEVASAQAREEGWPFVVGHGLDIAQMRALGLFVSPPGDEADHAFAEPGLFLLNPDGVLQAIDISNAPFSRPDLQSVLGGIRTIRREQPPIHGTA